MDDGLVMHWMSLEDVWAKTVSYAQNYEDILLGRVLRDPKGFYIDVGANHPIFHSVTKLFYERGWRGINVEPSPVVFDRLAADRPRDLNLNVGLSDRDGSLSFFDCPEQNGWSTFRPDLAEHYRGQGVAMVERSVPVTTLARVCEEHVSGPIDFLKIDAEGFEREVLLGSDFRRWRPRVLVIENSWPEVWGPVLQGIAYKAAAFDGLNQFFVRDEDEALIPLFAPLANVLDNFIPNELLRLIRGLVRERDEALALVATTLEEARLSNRLRSAVRRLGRRAG
jgi:FkbM family methyltransferase